ATVWLGLTAGCAKCHDHKYDPISQKEFYQLFAYFNNVPEKGKALKYGNSPPYIKAPTRAQQIQVQLLQSQLDSAEALFKKLQPELAQAQRAWEIHLDRRQIVDWTLERGLLARLPLHEVGFARPAENPRIATAGPLDGAAYFDGNRSLEAGDRGSF